MLAHNRRNRWSSMWQMSSRVTRYTTNSRNRKISTTARIEISQCPASNTEWFVRLDRDVVVHSSWMWPFYMPCSVHRRLETVKDKQNVNIITAIERVEHDLPLCRRNRRDKRREIHSPVFRSMHRKSWTFVQSYSMAQYFRSLFQSINLFPHHYYRPTP